MNTVVKKAKRKQEMAFDNEAIGAYELYLPPRLPKCDNSVSP
jgi:hypothetical protein